MSRHAVAGGITVRGTCTAGHVTEATTDPGRTSWEGPCGHDGCDLKVRANRRSSALAAAPAETPPPPAAAPDDKPRRLRQVDYDRQPRKRDQPAATPDTGKPDPAAPAPPAGAPPVQRNTDSDPAGDSPAAGGAGDQRTARVSRIRERITGRRAKPEGATRPQREFRLPY